MFCFRRTFRSIVAVALSVGMVLGASAAPYPAEASSATPKAEKAPSPKKSKSGKKKETPAPRSTLEGRIYGADGKKPLRGAVVELRSLDGGESRNSPPSDRQGRFTLKGIDYGWAEVVVHTEKGQFLSDQAINLPPGRAVTVSFSLLETADRPDTWWQDRNVEPPVDLASSLSGMASAQQKLIGVEYWKSPKGIAILAGAGVAALALIAIGGRGYKQTTTPTQPPVTTP